MRIGKTCTYSPQRKIHLVKRVTLGYQTAPWEQGETIWLCPESRDGCHGGHPQRSTTRGSRPAFAPEQGFVRGAFSGREGKAPAAAGAPHQPSTRTSRHPHHRRPAPAALTALTAPQLSQPSQPAALTGPRQGRIQPFHGVGNSSYGSRPQN